MLVQCGILIHKAKTLPPTVTQKKKKKIPSKGEEFCIFILYLFCIFDFKKIMYEC